MEDPLEPLVPDSWHLYTQMLRSRLFEKEVMRLWQEGAIPGEMHLSMGEEAIVAGTYSGSSRACVPSTPLEAGGLMTTALAHDGPVIYLEHNLLSENWLDLLGGGSRKRVKFDVPAEGARGEVQKIWNPIPIGQRVIRRDGEDLTIISVGVSVHRAIDAARILEKKSITAQVIDLRTVTALDKKLVIGSVSKTGRTLVVDEDYLGFGLSGELAAFTLDAGVSMKYSRVCTEDTIPFSRQLEYQTLPNVERIVESAVILVNS
jgi:pyruvate dehydrogenase E1 component beta subunit